MDRVLEQEEWILQKDNAS